MSEIQGTKQAHNQGDYPSFSNFPESFSSELISHQGLLCLPMNFAHILAVIALVLTLDSAKLNILNHFIIYTASGLDHRLDHVTTVFASATITKSCRLGRLNNRSEFSHGCGGWKFKIKVSACLVSSEASLFGLQFLLSHCALTWSPLCIHVPPWCFFLFLGEH